MKTIQSKIIVIIISIVVLLCLVFGVTACVLNYMTASQVLELSMEQAVGLASEVIQKDLQNTKLVVIETGCTARLANPENSVESKKEILDQKIANYGFIGGNVLDVTGKSIFDGVDFSDRDYFQASIKGEAFISGPLISKLTGEYSIMVSAPIWEGGVPNTKVVGVVYVKPELEILSLIVDKIKFGATGGAYIINKDGLSIAYPDRERVCKENTIELAKTDPSLAKLAKIETDMIAGKSGHDFYRYEGVKWVQSYMPVPNTDGWSVGIFAKQDEFMDNVVLSMIITIVLGVLFVLLGSVIAKIAAGRISNPIMQCVNRIRLLAEGDLKTAVPEIRTKDETKVLADSTKVLVNGLGDVVNDLTHVLSEMAGGNLNVYSTSAYNGDFIPLQTATQKIITSLNNILAQINQSAEEVFSGSGQVSSAAQALSQGATEQASSVEQLSATIGEISQQVHGNAVHAGDANNMAEHVGTEIKQSDAQMNQLIAAMTEISSKSGEIGKIVKAIEDIAFQTNILALNAAVEAARAGAAGKGFAVVADEVRNLAGKSADAAKSTTQLIEETIAAVQKGTMLADQTATSLGVVVQNAHNVVGAISEISTASEEQATSIAQVTQGIEQISSVVQTNSATAEESAAASEQLNGQAQMLKSLVAHFQLRDQNEAHPELTDHHHHQALLSDRF